MQGIIGNLAGKGGQKIGKEQYKMINNLLPKFVVFEGPDGVGKSSMSEKLAIYYREHFPDIKLYVDGFPGNIPGTLGNYVYKMHHNNIKGAPKIQSIANPGVQLLHIAAHVDKIENAIKPILMDNNGVVILDRYWWSTYAYSRITMNKESVLRMLESEFLFWEELNIKPKIIYIKRSKTFKIEEIDKEDFKKLDGFYEEIIDKQKKTGEDISIIQNEDKIESVFNEILFALGFID